jgi:hypothetical protein
VGLAEIGPGGLVLHKQPARPKQINETPVAGKFF